MGCDLTITRPTDTPLDSATYDSVRDVIWAVRGGRLFKCNALTGSKITEVVFHWPDLSPAGIIYEPTTDRLIVNYWNTNSQPSGSGVPDSPKMMVINPDSMAVTTEVAIPDVFGFGYGTMIGVAFGAKIFVNWWQGSPNIHRFNPVTLADEGGASAGNGTMYGDMALDSAGSQLFCAGDQDSVVTVLDLPDLLSPSTISLLPFENQSGIALAAGYLWLVGGDQNIVKVKSDGSEAPTQINTGVVNIKPWRIKYFSPLDRLLIAGWASNTVVSVNPNTGAVDEIYTGFDAPWDIVMTPLHAFAIQHGSSGLRLIV